MADTSWLFVGVAAEEGQVVRVHIVVGAGGGQRPTSPHRGRHYARMSKSSRAARSPGPVFGNDP